LATPDIVEEITKDDQQPSFKEPTAEAADHAYTEVLTEAVRAVTATPVIADLPKEEHVEERTIGTPTIVEIPASVEVTTTH
ncbi:unnamed protein product, partial [Rotaria socialis]